MLIVIFVLIVYISRFWRRSTIYISVPSRYRMRQVCTHDL